MPILNREDARDVEEHVGRIFAASQPDRANAIRALFVEKLDFNPDSGQVDLAAAPASAKLPEAAERIAQLDGVHVLYISLHIRGTDRVRKTEAAAAARLIAGQLGEDMLLVFTNTSRSQLHFIHPDFDGAQPTLRRMVVERDLPRRTAVEQFSNVYWNYGQSGSIRAALEEAFDVEPVTRKFFQEYKRVFEAAEEHVSGFGPDEKEEKRLFIQTLFNRLMFVYFLSRKSWLTFRGNNDYLNALWNDYRADPLRADFYTDRLRPLFFAGLNNPQSRNINRDNPVLHDRIGDVPFLNGGLFEKTDLDERDGVTVPDDAIEPVLSDLFDKFNFTVMESTPFDIEVAVDPEMLGKVFEELVTGRHESGSYYTPRPVVSFMCREALKGYLKGPDTGLSSEAVSKFVDGRDASKIPLPSAGRVADALDQVTVVDPACGSGAYLLGMMQELVELQIELYNVGVDARSLYDLKLHIIQRNLYGVDNDEFAVNIAMLRMWLSLAIEYEGEVPEPLPNLDFKVVCGDSLLGPDPSNLDLEHGLIERSGLGSLKADYMRERIGSAKGTLKDRIQIIESELRDALGGVGAPRGSIDWRIAFAEVFAARSGFDIVIANPPYVRMEKLNKDDQRKYKEAFPEVAASRADILVFFYARAIELMRPGGWLAFITSNKYMRAAYGKKLREFLRDSLIMSQVLDFGDLPVFAATSYPAVLVGQKGMAGAAHQMRIADLSIPVRNSLKSRGLSATLETVNKAMDGLSGLLDRHGHTNYPQTLLRQNGWILEDPALIRLFERLMNQGTPLGEFVDGRIYYGVKTGLNKAFVIDQYKRDELVDADPRSAEIIKPWLRGKDIKRWSADWAGLYIIFTSRGVDIDRYPAVRAHLELYRPNLEKRATSHLHPWYELQQPQEGIYHEFDNPKIIFKRFINAPQFTYDPSGFWHNNACDFAVTPSASLAAIVNSQIVWFLLRNLCTALANGYLQVFAQFLKQLPIPSLSVDTDQRLSECVEQLAHDPVQPDIEAEIEDYVSWSYGLSQRDNSLIKSWLERRSLVG